MNIKIISINMGKVLLINALFMFVSIVVSASCGFDEAFTPLLISFLITLITGAFPFIFVRDVPKMKLGEAYVTIVLAWLLSFLIGMMPYVLYGGEFTLVNAWFESVSGYTTTGSTILTDIESLPQSLLFWRSSTHFIGGLGVIVFLLLILPDSSPIKLQLTGLEISSIARSGYRYRAMTTTRVMLGVYVALTLVETLMLWAAGMTFLDAVNHSFSTTATGGFSTKNSSIMYYDSVLIELIILVFMALSAMHFGVIAAVFLRRSFKPLDTSVTKYYWSVIAFLSLFVTFVLIAQGGYTSFGKALLDSSFQVVSFISTTGFGQADNASWPFLANLMLMFAAFHCGCSGSTTGGVKADRVLMAIREGRNEMYRKLYPSSVIKTKLNGMIVRNEAVSSAALFIVVYVLMLLMSFILSMVCGLDVGDAFTGTLSSLGNVGPGMGDLGTMGNYAGIPASVKLLFSLDMFMGRIEIFPLFVVLSMIVRKRM